jgi:hypothetical protein
VCKQQNTKVYKGHGCNATCILNSSTRQRWVVSFMPQPLYSVKGLPHSHWRGDWVGLKNSGCDSKLFLPLLGIKSWPSSSYQVTTDQVNTAYNRAQCELHATDLPVTQKIHSERKVCAMWTQCNTNGRKHCFIHLFPHSPWYTCACISVSFLIHMFTLHKSSSDAASSIFD